LLFNEPVEYYEAIANELSDVIKEPWVTVEVESKLYEESVYLKIVFFRSDGSRESDVDILMMPEYFYELARVVSTEEKGLYKECHFMLKNDGKFDVEFKYD
jgi:hypothetical protein